MSSDTLRKLAAARVELELAKGQLAERQAILEQVAIYHAVAFARDWIRDSQEQIARLTDLVRAEALAAYQETGNKQPWPGVKITEHFVIPAEDKSIWGMYEGVPAKVPKATIARDLSGYLAEEGSDE